MSDLIDLALRLVDGLKRESSGSWAGPCPKCGGNDRFVVGGKKGIFHCRGCGASGGPVQLLQLVGRGCPEAHEEAGEPCGYHSCPAERCRLHPRRGQPSTARRVTHPEPPKARSEAPFVPADPLTPAELWRSHAEKLVEHAHQTLLSCPEPLAWLAGRGLPLEAVERHRLGWLPADAWRDRKAWGLPEVLRDDGKPKKLWLPQGLVLPSIDAEGKLFRLRIRRPIVKEGELRYYQVPGSGDDVAVMGDHLAALVVVESDLDALLIHHHAGDLVGVIPLTTAAMKPKTAAADACARAKIILVATDYEPRQGEGGKYENPGGRAAEWWLRTYKTARRCPVPAGKDPGEYAQQGGDIRQWILSRLPPSIGLSSPSTAAAPAPLRYLKGTSKCGVPYLVADTPELLAQALAEHPGRAPFLRAELDALRGLPQEQLHAVLLAKQVFPEGRVQA